METIGRELVATGTLVTTGGVPGCRFEVRETGYGEFHLSLYSSATGELLAEQAVRVEDVWHVLYHWRDW